MSHNVGQEKIIFQEKTEVYVLRKRVNLSSESSQLFSDEAVNLIRMGKQVQG